MATMALEVERVNARPRFYVGMAAVFVLIAFGGFTPTYWAKLANGSFSAAPIVYVHGTLLSIWTLFYFAQTLLVAAGRTPDHRRWGMAGISLATAVAISMLLATINSMHVADGLGMGEAGRRFAIVPLSSLLFFTAVVGLAIVKVRSSEVHKRLMILAMISVLQAAAGRVFAILLAPPGAIGPGRVVFTVAPGLAVDLLLVAALVYDWRTRGRPHPAYLIGGSLLVAKQVIIVPVAATAWWLAFAAGVERLAG